MRDIHYGGHIDRLQIVRYKKLESLSIEFDPGVNLISGANGTCKSSLLHLVSNSFQKLTKRHVGPDENDLVSALQIPGTKLNPKVETLARGDRQYNDPARGARGALYTAFYEGGGELGFRRHNSGHEERYSLKPYYGQGKGDSLPPVPVVYLGLSRLVPAGEYSSDDERDHRLNLKEESIAKVADQFARLTGIAPSDVGFSSLGTLKSRMTFTTDLEGVDSNTISAGQDNLLIILYALETLRAFNESSNGSPGSVLLIDEFDASLHPPLQYSLLDEFDRMAAEANIQTVVTTHSVEALESAIKKRLNVIYLMDAGSRVEVMSEPTMRKIRMSLTATSKDHLYQSQSVAVFTEDAEARELLGWIFQFVCRFAPSFAAPLQYLKFVDVNIGGEQLTSLFKDKVFADALPSSICILDGDHGNKFIAANRLIAMPGNDSPEKFLIGFAADLYGSNDPVFISEAFINEGFGREFQLRFQSSVDKKLDDCKKKNSTKKPREVYKDIWRRDSRYFEMLAVNWLSRSENYDEIIKFFKNLGILWKKAVQPFGVSTGEWDDCLDELKDKLKSECVPQVD